MMTVNTRQSPAVMTENCIRWAGGPGMVGGPTLAAAYLLHPPMSTPTIVAGALWAAVHIGFMTALICGVVLLCALFGRYLKSGGRYVGLAGFVMAVTSLLFVFGSDHAEVFIFPTMAVEFPAVVRQYRDGTMMPSPAFTFSATGILFLAGFVLFSWELLRTRATSRGAGLTTIAGTVVFVAGLSGFLPMTVVKAGAVLFGGGLVWLGVDLYRRSVPAAGVAAVN